MLLEMLLRGRDQLDGHELEATVLEAADDGADETTLEGVSVTLCGRFVERATCTPSGLMAMKLGEVSCVL